MREPVPIGDFSPSLGQRDQMENPPAVEESVTWFRMIVNHRNDYGGKRNDHRKTYDDPAWEED